MYFWYFEVLAHQYLLQFQIYFNYYMNPLCLRHRTAQWNSRTRYCNVEFEDCRLYNFGWQGIRKTMQSIVFFYSVKAQTHVTSPHHTDQVIFCVVEQAYQWLCKEWQDGFLIRCLSWMSCQQEIECHVNKRLQMIEALSPVSCR